MPCNQFHFIFATVCSEISVVVKQRRDHSRPIYCCGQKAQGTKGGGGGGGGGVS